ncbi:ABC-F family ATP-binding cassette domain-containing protein [Clostridium sp. Marseille-P2415]|uniref:ABC-F family ATP-binding cassette domain-containing protein n=1 Tax=Clostridium sp. Marseille-P2415 TaxID=1805471 RepID=UPI000988404C|nr:ABC-F family ATP-binding cassette domain-containing protein [Clostridium sp. Marseille-P2415]
MSLLDITGLSHSFGEHSLYRNGELSLNKGEHMGIVGQNGTGKSTLIRICTEQVIPDEGRVLWQPGISVGYLDQYASTGPEMTVKEFLKNAFSRLYETEEKMNELYRRAGNGNMEVLKLAAQYQEQLELGGFYLIETRIGQVAEGLGLVSAGLDRPIGQMSGGQRAKAILAKLLLEKPDVLLLDEPGNFLDKEHVSWLGKYLSGLENAFMVVSHDSDFLESAVNCICDIDHEKITKYFGTYQEFLKKKALLLEDYTRRYSVQQKEIKKTEEFIRRNIAGRKSRMARGRQKQLDRMERLEELEQKEIRPFFHFPELPLTETVHLSVKHLSVGYGEPVLSDISFTIKGGEKAVITGFNGIGKSTLLKTLVKQIPALGGDFIFSEQADIGYFEQEPVWKDKKLTPVRIVSDEYPTLTIKEIRKALARCGIYSKHADQSIGTLSGGEQAKVKLCLLTLRPCNFLLMDEPTNHLDIQAKESLKTALSRFPGTVLFVSHEESFYRDWVGRVIRMEQGL